MVRTGILDGAFLTGCLGLSSKVSTSSCFTVPQRLLASLSGVHGSFWLMRTLFVLLLDENAPCIVIGEGGGLSSLGAAMDSPGGFDDLLSVGTSAAPWDVAGRCAGLGDEMRLGELTMGRKFTVFLFASAGLVKMSGSSCPLCLPYGDEDGLESPVLQCCLCFGDSWGEGCDIDMGRQ